MSDNTSNGKADERFALDVAELLPDACRRCATVLRPDSTLPPESRQLIAAALIRAAGELIPAMRQALPGDWPAWTWNCAALRGGAVFHDEPKAAEAGESR
jgi:hypothetical protein